MTEETTTEEKQAEIGTNPPLHSEAPASLNTFAVTNRGWDIQITLRDDDEFRLFERFAALVKHLDGLNIKPKIRGNGSTSPAQTAASHPMNVESAPTPVPVAPTPASQGRSRDGYTNLGTGQLTQITVDMDGKAQFLVQGRRYPLVDGRGADMVASLFDADLGFTPQHFASPNIYVAGRDFGDLKLDYGKSSTGYWDVLRIHQ